MDNPKEFQLQFSDTSYGHPEFGFIPRKPHRDPDDEDIRATVVEDVIRVKSPI